MNKTFIAILALCLIGSSTAFQVDVEKCFTEAATFTQTIKNVISLAHTSPLGIDSLLTAVYNSAETLNPFINSCGLDISFLDQLSALKPYNSTNCFSEVEKITTIVQELKQFVGAKDISNELLAILPKVVELL
jgi:hypothetical protein